MAGECLRRVGWLAVLLAGPALAVDDAAVQRVIAGAQERRQALLTALLASPYPSSGAWRHEGFALAAYWLNQRTAEAEAGLQAVRAELLPAMAGTGESGFHWHAYLLERLVFLFGRDSPHYAGRLSPTAEALILELLWTWAAPRCRLEMTLPERDLWVWGSENHHAQAWSSFWGAAHLFAASPAYRDRRYDDGTTPAAMAAAFDAYFLRFARHRATGGLLVECNSDYGKYTLGGWYNLADFAPDPRLRLQFAQLLNLFWADWATEQFDGQRGGSRHRCYPGRNSTALSSIDGLPWYHFGLGAAKSKHPGHWCGATTFWRPDPVVVDLALDPAGRGVYTSTSRRLGLAATHAADAPLPNYAPPGHPFHSPQGVYALDPAAGLRRVSYVTPDYLLGASLLPAQPAASWTNISSQNRWDGVIFAGHPTARIFPQPLRPAKGSVYNASWSVVHRGVMLTQRLRESNAKGWRVWFDRALPRVERDGWVFVTAPRAYAAVRVVRGPTTWEPDSQAQHHEADAALDLGDWLACGDEFSPVILEVARREQCADLAAFQASVVGNPWDLTDGLLRYTSRLHQTTLTLDTTWRQPPSVDGQPVDFRPSKAFDSPFLSADFGAATVQIQKDARRLTLDFGPAG
ncbi:MAG: hypothetical protein IT204_24775 [Fimbriimonadaceae bacterium]|nr:hypothetical protein [Fimbriimonadaceae bacterium]